MLAIQIFRTRETTLQHEKQLCLKKQGPLPGHTWFPPVSAVLMFALYCLNRRYHPSHSMQLVIPPTSQIAFAGAAESKASTICLINDLWSFYERVSLSLHQGKWANLMINVLLLCFSNWAQDSVAKLSQSSGRFWKTLKVTTWKSQERKVYHSDRQGMPLLEFHRVRKER